MAQGHDLALVAIESPAKLSVDSKTKSLVQVSGRLVVLGNVESDSAIQPAQDFPNKSMSYASAAVIGMYEQPRDVVALVSAKSKDIRCLLDDQDRRFMEKLEHACVTLNRDDSRR